MPIEIGIWRIGKKADGASEALRKIASSKFDEERRLEELLAHQLDVLGSDLLAIGRQVITPSGKRADVLAVDPTGDLYVIELKRDRTPRDAVAQVLDYGSWASKLSHEEILEIYQEQHPDIPFEQAFSARFGSGPPESLNQAHRLILVASELDAASQRIIDYCQDSGMPINAVFFRYFKDGDSEYLARSWLVDPEQAETKIKETGKEPWTGDYYVSFGEFENRNWDDARKYGFISGGHGVWYSRTLSMLHPPNRVLVHIPGRGYVGVGQVIGDRVKAADLPVSVNARTIPLKQVPDLKATAMWVYADDEQMAEYAVPVKWLAQVPREQAYWENGFFANQNTVCKLRSRFTRDRVLQHFGLSA